MGKLVFSRFPRTDGELHAFIKAVWGINVPRHNVCPDHIAPFDALAEAYFGRTPMSIWRASRGLGGKSFMLGTLSLTEAVTYGVEITVLGGSAAQSMRVHECTQMLWAAKNAPRSLLVKEPTRYETKLRNKSHIRALMASTRSVRGPHPARLRLDEIDEMDLNILESALGQPMPQRGVESQTVCSSTHQYPDGTVTAMLKRAGEHPEWGNHVWCISSGSKVAMADGTERVIEDVVPGDVVMTHEGTGIVTMAVCNGHREVIRLSLGNGRTLALTPDHEVLTDTGWVRAGLLQPGQSLAGLADTVPTVGSDVGVLGSELMAVGAVGRAILVEPRTTLVLAGSDDLQMVGVDAEGVATQVIDGAVIGDLAVEQNHDHPVSVHGGGGTEQFGVVGCTDVHHPVVGSGASCPDEAVTIGHGNGEQFGNTPWRTLSHLTTLSLVSSERVLIEVPVYDLTVETAHSFVAEGLVVHNCYRESMGTDKHPGWLDPVEVQRKKAIMPKAMWDAEFEMQEPSFEGRAIDEDSINYTFDPALGVYKGEAMEYIVTEGPDAGCRYITGVDWAKEKDWTVIRTFRDEGMQWREIAFERIGRISWPAIVARVNERCHTYPGVLVYDNTGLGNVVGDYLALPKKMTVMPIDMLGRRREVLFNEYISAIEGRSIKCPRIDFSYTEHRYTTSNDLYGSGHPPDSLVAGALAWHARNEGRSINIPPIMVDAFSREQSPWRF